MKKYLKYILYVFFAAILVYILLHLVLQIRNTVKQDKKLFSSMPQEKSFSFCSTFGTTAMSDWGIRDVDSVGKRTIDVETDCSYWKIKGCSSIYMYADTFRYEWGILTTKPSKIPTLSKNKISRIEIADGAWYNNFYFGDEFTWQDVQIYEPDLDTDAKQELANIIADNLYDSRESLEKIERDEASKYQKFYIRFYFENFDEIFYSPSEFSIAKYDGNWFVLVDDRNSNKYAIIDIPTNIVDKLNRLELLPKREYKATWYG